MGSKQQQKQKHWPVVARSSAVKVKYEHCLQALCYAREIWNENL